MIDQNIVDKLKEALKGKNEEVPAETYNSPNDVVIDNAPQGAISDSAAYGQTEMSPNMPKFEDLASENKKIAEKLKNMSLQKKAVKIYNESEGDPEMQQQAMSLIQRLRNNVQDTNYKFNPFMYFADPQTQQQIALAHKSTMDDIAMQQAEQARQDQLAQHLIDLGYKQQLEQKKEEERNRRFLQEVNRDKALQKYREEMLKMQQKQMEESKNKKAEDKAFRRRTKDESVFTKAMAQMDQTGRGTVYARKIKDNMNAAEVAMNRLRAIKEGKLVPDYQTAMDISMAISRLISGGVPAQSLVSATIYKSLGGDTNRILQYLKGKPESYINSIQLDQLEGQLNNIYNTKKKQYDDWQKKLVGSVGYILRRPENEDLRGDFETIYPELAQDTFKYLNIPTKKEVENITQPDSRVSETVVVTDGTNEYTIPKEDLDEALAEGLQVKE